MKSLQYLFILSISSVLLFSSCDKDGDINIFTIEDDKKLGKKLHDQILNSPDEYNVLSQEDNPEAYSYLDAIVQDILNSGELTYGEEFKWDAHIIKNDTILNAFAAPGGYIFVYTGLIKYLDEKDDFAGVMGHEMAHADQRHSTEQLTKQYGVTTLLDIILGENSELVKNVLVTLVSLKFSRSDEKEADKYSVIYLCETEYAANAAASFFQKLKEMGTARPPVFLSTHPAPENRVENINMEAQERDCDTTYNSDDAAWENFQESL